MVCESARLPINNIDIFAKSDAYARQSSVKRIASRSFLLIVHPQYTHPHPPTTPPLKSDPPHAPDTKPHPPSPTPTAPAPRRQKTTPKPPAPRSRCISMSIDATTRDYAYLLREQRAYAPTLARSTAKERRDKLDRILRYLDDAGNKDRLVAALRSDLGKPSVESILSEIGVIYTHVKYIQRHLRRWMEPRRVSSPLSMLGTMNYLYYEPKGSVLIISPWNYPFNLAIVPLVYAIGAGCTVTLKPSEASPATSDYLRSMLHELYAENEVKVVLGEADTAAALTQLPWDHIFFTGSPAVGKKVMAAAAPNLTPVTLELGGKSPCIVDADVNVTKSARNVCWGKFFNAGQTCTAPDYLLVNDDIADRYVPALAAAVQSFYGDNPQASESFARVVNEKQFDHLVGLLDDAVGKGATVVCGGTHDRAERYFAPTVLTGVTREMRML